MKVELHLHLEGAAPPAFIRGLAQEKSIDIAGLFDDGGGYLRGDFASFLKVYAAAAAVLQTPQDYARLVHAVREESAASNVIYCETFLSPNFCGAGDLPAWRDHVAAMREAAGPRLKGIATAIRHLGPAAARRAAICAAETAGDFLTGFGLAGDERIGRPGDFAWAFDCAREAGLGLTAHAGEFAGPAAIRDTLRDLRPARIGHGVRAIEDPALVDDLAERGVTLEVCPGSNIALGLYPDWRRHPIGELYRRGVKVTVSTDDPPFFRTTLAREYDRLHAAFDWDAAVFRELNLNAARAAFCDEATRAELIKQLESPCST